ncbi:MAG TPA: elongation factor P [Bacilli bacterium]|nr:elongation factor P [Bacilli bacterium]
MISSNEFKTGMTIEYEEKIYQILEFQHVKPGKGQAYVRTKLKNMRTGATTDIAIASGIKIKKANIEKKTMQYIYDGMESLAFMDMESFIQVDIPAERLTYEKSFLKEGTEVTIIDFQGEILGVMLPEKVVLEVTECDPNVKGNTVSNAMKGATVETGYSLQVPLFIEVGDKIIIGTNDGKYNSRA